MSDLNDLALQLHCPYCGAEPTYWCVTARPYSRPAGELTTWLHADRMRPILDAWRLGHDQGYDSALRAAAQRLEGARLGHVWAKGAPIISSDVVERWLRDQNRKAT